MTQTLTFDTFGPDHMDAALRLSRAAGWPHRATDWALVAGLSRGIVALEAGEVVATALATPFGPVAMANMIIVDERLRGRGLGRQVMEHALALAEPQEWRLVATQSGLPLYRKLGFVECGLVHQHQGPGHQRIIHGQTGANRAVHTFTNQIHRPVVKPDFQRYLRITPGELRQRRQHHQTPHRRWHFDPQRALGLAGAEQPFGLFKV